MATTISRIGTSNNLEDGGTYDLLVMGFPNGFPRGYVSFEMSDTPRRVTGVQKVVQTFLLALLSTTGSDPIRPRRGTPLSSFIGSSNLGGTYDEIEEAVRESVKNAEEQTKATLNSDLGDIASQLAGVEILFVETGEEALNVGIRFTTLAGTSAAIAIPFPQTDLALNG